MLVILIFVNHKQNFLKAMYKSSQAIHDRQFCVHSNLKTSTMRVQVATSSSKSSLDWNFRSCKFDSNVGVTNQAVISKSSGKRMRRLGNYAKTFQNQVKSGRTFFF